MTKHIFDYFDWNTFPNKEEDKDNVKTRFDMNGLVVYIGEYSISIDRLFYIINHSKKVIYKDLTSNIK